MSENITNDNSERTISLEALYDTMSKEVDGLYRRMITSARRFLVGRWYSLGSRSI